MSHATRQIPRIRVPQLLICHGSGWVMSHRWTSHVTCESCHTWVILQERFHTSASPSSFSVTVVEESCPTGVRLTSHMSHVTHESCHIWVLSHIWVMSHICVMSHLWVRSHMWVMSHVRSCVKSHVSRVTRQIKQHTSSSHSSTSVTPMQVSWISHVTYDSCHTWIITHMRHGKRTAHLISVAQLHIHHTDGGVMSHLWRGQCPKRSHDARIWISIGTHMNAYICRCVCVCAYIYIHI